MVARALWLVGMLWCSGWLLGCAGWFIGSSGKLLGCSRWFQVVVRPSGWLLWCVRWLLWCDGWLLGSSGKLLGCSIWFLDCSRVVVRAPWVVAIVFYRVASMF